MTAHAPHIEAIGAGVDFAALPELRDVILVEVSQVDLKVNPTAPTAQMAALTPRHFDLVHGDTEGMGAKGVPVYFKRMTTGFALHPRTNKPYWLRVTYRAPIKHGAPPPPEA